MPQRGFSPILVNYDQNSVRSERGFSRDFGFNFEDRITQLRSVAGLVNAGEKQRSKDETKVELDVITSY